MKRKTLTLTALAVGVCCFSAAAFANNSAANGYEVLKQSIWNTAGNNNYSMESNVIFTADGEEVAAAYSSEQADGGRCHTLSSNTDVYGESYGHESYSSSENGSVSNYFKYSGNDKIFHEAYQGTSYNSGTLASIDPDDKETHKYMRFAELLTDAVVGNLKNNFVCVAEDDNGAAYKIELSSVQIPELINSGISLVFTDINDGGYDYTGDNTMDKAIYDMGEDPIIDSAALEFSVDNQNRLTHIDATAVLAGNGHDITVHANVEISDYGTTVVPDVPDEWKAKASEFSEITAIGPDVYEE